MQASRFVLGLLVTSLLIVGLLPAQTVQTNPITELKAKAENGNKTGQYNLGVAYENGLGVPTNYTDSVKWYRKSADQDFAPAEANLGCCYHDGQGVSRDYIEAVHWWRKAAEQGNAIGEFNLGACYINGEGIPKDYIEGYKWLNLAAAQDYEPAKHYLPGLENRMAAQQIAEAQQLSREFRPRKEGSNNSTSPNNPFASGTGFFITDDGYLISNYHVVKDATKVCLLTSAGLIDAKVVQVDAANDLALLKAEGRFAPLPIAASRTANLGGTVATVGFPDIGMQGFSPKLAKGEIASLSGAGMTRGIFKSACQCSRARLEFKL